MPEEIETKPEETVKEQSQASFLNKIKIHKFKILGGVLGVLVLAGAIFGAYKLGQRQAKPVSLLTPTPTPLVNPVPPPTEVTLTPTPTPTFTTTPTPAYFSNLKDPLIKTQQWSYYPDQSCRFGDPTIWHFNGVAVDGTPCDGQVLGQNWEKTDDRYEVTLSLDNTKNSQRCSSDRNFYSFQSTYPVGSKDILYLKDLSRLQVKLSLKNSPLTSACDDPEAGCDQYQCPPDYAEKTYGWTTLIIGIPMYDKTNNRNLWLEIAPYWTKNAVYGGPQDDSNLNYYLFWGENPQEELHRIMISHPSVKGQILPPGESASYTIDLLPIIESLHWGRSHSIDWGNVHVQDVYIGTESWGWTLTNFTVSNLDLVYLPTF